MTDEQPTPEQDKTTLESLRSTLKFIERSMAYLEAAGDQPNLIKSCRAHADTLNKIAKLEGPGVGEVYPDNELRRKVLAEIIEVLEKKPVHSVQVLAEELKR